MLYVLEGCDGVGKSTVARHIQNIVGGAEIIHCTAETPNTFEYFKGIIEEADHKNIIADRFCYGQFVYQTPAERHMSWGQLRDLELLMQDHGVKVILVLANIEDIKRRLEKRGETTSIPVHKIVDNFLQLFEVATVIYPYVWYTSEEG